MLYWMKECCFEMQYNYEQWYAVVFMGRPTQYFWHALALSTFEVNSPDCLY
jgi:hypothetical protein